MRENELWGKTFSREVYALGHVADKGDTITRDHSEEDEGRRITGIDQSPSAGSEQPASTTEVAPVDELLELVEDAAASSVELATACILSRSLDVHWLRLRLSWPASLYA